MTGTKKRDALGAMPIDVGDGETSMHADYYGTGEVKLEVHSDGNISHLWVPAEVYQMFVDDITAEYKLSERIIKDSRDRLLEETQALREALMESLREALS